MLLKICHKRLHILTWHVHGDYLYYLTHAPHDFYLVTKPHHPPGYAGRIRALPWGKNVHEVPIHEVAVRQFDCVVYQQRSHYEEDRFTVLSNVQRALPHIYIEHNPPQHHPFEQCHWVQDKQALLVHVTHFNQLMWDSGITPTRVIEHGVTLPEGLAYTGELNKGIVVINHLAQHGRQLGADIFQYARKQVPLEFAGMDAEPAGGMSAISYLDLAALISRYRFYFAPLRWTSLGLVIIEAMMMGMPIIGLATTELSSVIRNGINGYIDTRIDTLLHVMRQLLNDARLAQQWGKNAQRTAQQRFNIVRFVRDWTDALHQICD